MIFFFLIKLDLIEKIWYNEKDSMFGYFVKLFKSIKDILIKKNFRCDWEFNVMLLWNGLILFY